MCSINEITLLALDTATEACSAALWHNGQCLSRFELAPREHTQRILPLIDGLLKQATLSIEHLDAIIFCRGPGSFTGVRIGIGITQGLALGGERPVMGFSSLVILAQGARRKLQAERVLVAIDARMGEVYWAEYQFNQQTGLWVGQETEQVITPEKARLRLHQLSGSWHYAGTGWQAYPQLSQLLEQQSYPLQVTLPEAEDMLSLAIAHWQQDPNPLCSVTEIEPLYLRNEVTWKKLPGRD